MAPQGPQGGDDACPCALITSCSKGRSVQGDRPMIKACMFITDTSAGMRRSGAGPCDQGEGQRAPALWSVVAHASCASSLPAPSHTAPGPTAFPALPALPRTRGKLMPDRLWCCGAGYPIRIHCLSGMTCSRGDVFPRTFHVGGQTWPKHQLHGCGNYWILLRGDAPNYAAV